MSMSKEDSVALADTFKDAFAENGFTREPGFDEDRAIYEGDVKRALVAFCKAQNPAFEEDRWLAYLAGECGPNGGKVK